MFSVLFDNALFGYWNLRQQFHHTQQRKRSIDPSAEILNRKRTLTCEHCFKGMMLLMNPRPVLASQEEPRVGRPEADMTNRFYAFWIGGRDLASFPGSALHSIGIEVRANKAGLASVIVPNQAWPGS